MTHWKGPVLLAMLVLVCVTHKCSSDLIRACDEPQFTNETIANFLTERRGNVVLVAFLKGYCHYCIRQARTLQALKTYLAQVGYSDVDMVIVNGGEERSRNLVHNLVDASPIPVIQDTPGHYLYRHVFRASKDDFVVFDRCGQLAMYIPHPYSDLSHPIVERVVKAIHDGRQPCYCSLDNTDQYPGSPQQGMAADDPGVDYLPSFQCSPLDWRCRRYQRLLYNTGVNPGELRRVFNNYWRRMYLDGTPASQLRVHNAPPSFSPAQMDGDGVVGGGTISGRRGLSLRRLVSASHHRFRPDVDNIPGRFPLPSTDRRHWMRNSGYGGMATP